MAQRTAAAPSAPVVAAICTAEILGLAGFSIGPALLPQLIEAWSLTNTQAGWLAGITSDSDLAAAQGGTAKADLGPQARVPDLSPREFGHLASSAGAVWRSCRVAGEVIEQQLADARRLLIAGVVADARRRRERVIRLDEFSRAFRGYAADRVIGLAQMNRVGRRVGPIGARSPRAPYQAGAASIAGGLPITDKCFFDRFAGNAIARQAVPHPLPVFGEQPLSAARIGTAGPRRHNVPLALALLGHPTIHPSSLSRTR